MTHRQFALWQEWLAGEWNHPDRTDFYLMAVACQVTRVLAKNPASIKLTDFRLKFGPSDARPPVTKEQALEWSKAKWLGAMTMGVVERRISRREAAELGLIELPNRCN